jgi:hypothetical protein
LGIIGMLFERYTWISGNKATATRPVSRDDATLAIEAAVDLMPVRGATIRNHLTKG